MAWCPTAPSLDWSCQMEKLIKTITGWVRGHSDGTFSDLSSQMIGSVGCDASMHSLSCSEYWPLFYYEFPSEVTLIYSYMKNSCDVVGCVHLAQNERTCKWISFLVHFIFYTSHDANGNPCTTDTWLLVWAFRPTNSTRDVPWENRSLAMCTQWIFW